MPATDINTTKVSNRNDIFDNDQENDMTTNEEANRRMEALMNMVVVEEQQDTTNMDNQETMEEEEEEEFAFRLFSTGSVAKVSIKEKGDDEANALSQQIANQQQIEQDETDPDFVTRITQASISYDDIMQQSTWAYPALRLPKRVIHINNNDMKSDTTTSTKRKRKSKKRRDYEKAVKEGRIIPKPNMRDTRTPGGWPGYPGARTPCAIIKTQSHKARSGGFKSRPQVFKNSFISRSSSGRGGRGGSSHFKKMISV
ncbi:uncharacterized protein BX664DRAFT_296206 [Halteromyces radiatus]|uniref:uncharacterized protein n=1 Tax=Halteromyces radiatus TaxID=101107 RepID=UPI00221F00D6|nr:uncharacterized protein BX664DRAFT_296206 [Halteromyces radiatus]KAI8088834.1 hypothetical protein BX664DRAFT_296206 [Halteromyces radiatus]